MLDYHSDHPFHLEHEQEGLLDPSTHVDRPIDTSSSNVNENNQSIDHRRRRILPWMLLIPSLIAYSFTKYYGIDRSTRIDDPSKDSVFKAEESENMSTVKEPKETLINVLQKNRDVGERSDMLIVSSKDETSSSRDVITSQTSHQKIDSHQVSLFEKIKQEDMRNHI